MNETSAANDGRSGDATLELLTDDERVWTAVPVDATDDERVSAWLSIAGGHLRDLEEWR